MFGRLGPRGLPCPDGGDAAGGPPADAGRPAPRTIKAAPGAVNSRPVHQNADRSPQG